MADLASFSMIIIVGILVILLLFVIAVVLWKREQMDKHSKVNHDGELNHRKRFGKRRKHSGPCHSTCPCKRNLPIYNTSEHPPCDHTDIETMISKKSETAVFDRRDLDTIEFEDDEIDIPWEYVKTHTWANQISPTEILLQPGKYLANIDIKYTSVDQSQTNVTMTSIDAETRITNGSENYVVINDSSFTQGLELESAIKQSMIGGSGYFVLTSATTIRTPIKRYIRTVQTNTGTVVIPSVRTYLIEDDGPGDRNHGSTMSITKLG